MTPNGDRATSDRPSRAALLVVHGIGEQAAYSTVDRVVRGLRTVLGGRVDRLTHTSMEADGQVMSGVRLSLNASLPRSGARELDVFEGYWAPMAKGLITARGVLAWTRQMLLTPFRRWSQMRLDHVSLGRRLELVVGEVVAALGFTALLAIGIALIVRYSDAFTSNPFNDYDIALSAVIEMAAGLAAGAFLLRAGKGTLGPLVGRLRRRGHVLYVTRVLKEPVTFEDTGLDEPSAGDESTRIWGEAAWVAAVLSVGVVALIEYVHEPVESAGSEADVAEKVGAVSDFGEELWIAIALVGVAFVVGRLLSSVLGDVAVYVADDTATYAGRLRSHILAGIQTQLRALLENPAYDSVHVVGHSLGTVISYDALNNLRIEVEHVAASDDQAETDLIDREAYDRFGSLVTVACPLDHIAYFWRSDGNEANPIQHQLIERRRALRTFGSTADSGRFSLNEEFATATRKGYYPIEPARFAWLNIRASPDPISTPLLNFRPDENAKVRFSPVTLTAHTKVMSDRRTYERILRYL